MLPQMFSVPKRRIRARSQLPPHTPMQSQRRNIMGHWEQERGDIILPSAEFAAVRQAVQKAVQDHQEKVFEETQTFWKGLTRKEQWN